jgi:hypothetical protein
MRTTVDLPDEIFRDLKALAARRGTSLKTVIRFAVEHELRKAEQKAGRRVKFPILASSQPGVLAPTNAEIDELLA